MAFFSKVYPFSIIPRVKKAINWKFSESWDSIIRASSETFKANFGYTLICCSHHLAPKYNVKINIVSRLPTVILTIEHIYVNSLF